MGYKIPAKDVIAEVIIQDYPEKVMTSVKRRTYYKKWAKNMPKKYLKGGYSKNKDGFLIDKDGNKVVKNTRTAGTPRFYNIQGQNLWDFNIHPMTKAKVATELKIIYYESFRELNKDMFEGRLLGVSMEFSGPIIKNGRIEEDLDNLERWHKKCILDALCGNVQFNEATSEEGKKMYKPDREKYPQILIDDNLYVIRELPVKFTESDHRELRIKIYEV